MPTPLDILVRVVSKLRMGSGSLTVGSGGWSSTGRANRPRSATLFVGLLERCEEPEGGREGGRESGCKEEPRLGRLSGSPVAGDSEARPPEAGRFEGVALILLRLAGLW